MPVELSDADVFGAAPAAPAQALQQAPQPQSSAPIVYDGGHGISVEVGGGDGSAPQPQAPPQAQAAPGPQEMSDADVFGAAPAPVMPTQALPRHQGNILSDAVAGAWRPLENYGHQVLENKRRLADQAVNSPLPTSLGDAARRFFDDGGALGAVAGIPAAAGAAVTGLFTRPIAGQVSKVLPTPYQAPHLTMAGGKLGLTAPQAMDPTDAAQGVLDTALSGARPVLPEGVPFGPRAPLPKAMTLDEVGAAKDAAYAKVDASGFAFPQADVQQLAQEVAAEVARKGGPSKAKLYPASDAMSDRLSALAQQPGGVPLTQLEELRGDIYDALVKPGDRESTLGGMMRQKIDAMIDAANTPDIREARDLNTRYMKMRAITDKLDSAGLRSQSTYSGGNYNNAVRQNLRPLVDPTSSQKIRNLSPEEEAALRGAVMGTPAQNVTRRASKLLTNKIVQVPFGVLTHGVGNAVMEGAGAILNKVGQQQTGKAVQNVLDLMAIGGSRAAPSAASLPRVPPVPVLSGPGLVGLDVLARRLQAKPSAELPHRTNATRSSQAIEKRR